MVQETERPFTGIRSNTPLVSKETDADQILFGAKQIDLIFVANWNHPNAIGLTGIELIQGNETVVKLSAENLSCNVRTETLDRLINDKNLTVEKRNMWCVPYDGEDVILSVRFDTFVYLSGKLVNTTLLLQLQTPLNYLGIRIWNYNESLDMSSAGVSKLKILLDGKVLPSPISESEVFWIRRAPGNVCYDFVQDIRFDQQTTQNIYTRSSEDDVFNPERTQGPDLYEYPDMPVGFVIQFNIFSTWSDQYYCGLNGIEVYDHMGKKIYFEESSKLTPYIQTHKRRVILIFMLL